MGSCRQDARIDAERKVQGSAEHVNHHHGRQNQTFGRARQIRQILPGPLITFLVLVMRDERIGANTYYFVEQVKSQQVVRKRAADGAEQGERKTGVKASLLVLM